MRSFLVAAFVLVSASGADLRITVYDQAHVTKEVRQAALDELRQILRASAIEVVIEPGDPAASEASLITLSQTPPKGREREAACRARRDIALEIAPDGSALRSAILGMAQPLAREGLNVQVFDDRIRDAAMRWNRSYNAVLAHVIVHEIGHVLLRSNAHSSSGIMSANWGDHEYDRLARGLLRFSREESRRMLATLSGSSCADAGWPGVTAYR